MNRGLLPEYIMNTMEHDVIIDVPRLGEYVALSASDPLLFEKELIYEGTFKKGDFEFSVDPPTLEHWHRMHALKLANGVETPIPLEHTEDPEKNRGYLVETAVRKNDRGKSALFGKIKFRDADAAKLALSTDTSIFVPKEQLDGNGKRYPLPIKHVAITSYPVIPGLSPFKALRLAFDDSEEGSDSEDEDTLDDEDEDTQPPPTMSGSLESLAEKLGLDPTNIDGVELEDKIVEMFTVMKTKIEQQMKQQQPPQAPQQPPQAQPPQAPQQQAPQAPPPPNEEKKPQPFAASLVREIGNGRRAVLRGLVHSGNITKAACDSLEKRYCDEGALALSLSGDKDSTGDFESMVNTLKLNVAFPVGEHSGPQLGGVALSHPSVVQNPVVADAERRHKESKER